MVIRAAIKKIKKFYSTHYNSTCLWLLESVRERQRERERESEQGKQNHCYVFVSFKLVCRGLKRAFPVTWNMA